jgi:hypothetical protein
VALGVRERRPRVVALGNYHRLVAVAEGRSPVTTDVPVLLRQGARAVAAGRVALGLTALAWPRVVARPWVGSADSVTGRVFGRALGGRDLALGLGAVVALESNSDDASGWVAAGALCDALDVAASLASWRELPRFTRWLVLASAGGAAVAGAAGAVALRGSRKPVSDDQAPETGQAVPG